MTRQGRRERIHSGHRNEPTTTPHARSGIPALIVIDAFLALIFITAALLAQPSVATLAGSACVTVALQLARHLRS